MKVAGEYIFVVLSDDHDRAEEKRNDRSDREPLGFVLQGCKIFALQLIGLA